MAVNEPLHLEETEVVRRSRWPWQLFRVMVLLELLSLLLQTVTAGQLLGRGTLGSLHGAGATFVHLFALLLVVAAILLFRPGRGPAWPIAAAAVILVGGMVQSALGGGGTIMVHVPLGVSLIVITTWLLFRPGSPAPLIARAGG
ncbi:hypothetical protein [Microlunatus speluncae]|uniref:hypothetical protein n=1 Tax=Microlunatus speluncae TaxID=2594267 RepID=UPI0012666955|nr:hypothetical protein [Microlunatus speluncae]